MSSSDASLPSDGLREHAKLAHDLRGPLITMEGFAGEIGRALDELEALLGENAPAGDVAARLAEALERDLKPCLEFVECAARTLHGRIDALDTGAADAVSAQ